MDRELHCCGDLQQLVRLYNKISGNEQNFFDTLESMLEIAMLVPLCEEEYAAHRDLFIKFERVYRHLKDMRELFESYDLELKFSPYLQRSISEREKKEN